MARYCDAVQWIADNDDSDLGDPSEGGFLISISLVADLWGKEAWLVASDVQRRRDIDGRRHQREIDAEYDEEDRMMDARGGS